MSNMTGETSAHIRLKRLALLWAQAQGYSICAVEVSLPRSRYRADVAAYRPEPNGIGATAIFECKQALSDLRRDNCCTSTARQRLEIVFRRRQTIERHLRVHYPNLRVADTLFPEFDSYDFAAIEHRGYARVLRELTALQKRLYDCTKFETLSRYRSANLFFLVLTSELYNETEIPAGWGTLVESDGALSLLRKPVRHENTPENRLHLLERIARTGTRGLNRQIEITFDDVTSERCRSCP